MHVKSRIELLPVLKSAAVMFCAPLSVVLLVLLAACAREFFVTNDFGVVLERTEAFRLSYVNVWLSYLVYGIAAVWVGYRTARSQPNARLHIWAVIALVVGTHLVLRLASNAAMIGAFNDHKALQLPVILILTAFVGFHLARYHCFKQIW